MADGTINMPDGHGGYKECWYGEVIKRVAKSNNEVKYFRINPVNDKTIGLDNIKIIRHGGGFIHGGGYCWYENKPNDKYKVWNNQVNTTGTPLTLDKPTLNITSDDNYSYEYHTVLLNEDNTVYNDNYTDNYKFRFGLLQVILNLEDNKLFNVMLVHKVVKLMMVRLQ